MKPHGEVAAPGDKLTDVHGRWRKLAGGAASRAVHMVRRGDRAPERWGVAGRAGAAAEGRRRGARGSTRENAHGEDEDGKRDW